MMGRRSGQMQMVVLDIESLIPDSHLLRRIARQVDFGFINEVARHHITRGWAATQLTL
jgi:hypothetical protein